MLFKKKKKLTFNYIFGRVKAVNAHLHTNETERKMILKGLPSGVHHTPTRTLSVAWLFPQIPPQLKNILTRILTMKIILWSTTY